MDAVYGADQPAPGMDCSAFDHLATVTDNTPEPRVDGAQAVDQTPVSEVEAQAEVDIDASDDEPDGDV